MRAITTALGTAVIGCMAAACSTDSPADADTITSVTTGTSTTTDPGTTTSIDGTTGDGETTDDGMTSIVLDDTGTTAADESSTGEPPPPAVCGNNIREGDEVCDLTDLGGATCESLGYDGGSLSCFVNCTGFNIENCYVCGNGIVDPAEDCEDDVPPAVTCATFGLGGGTVVCGGDCFFDTTDCSVCGDGVSQGVEACDGADLSGETCQSLGLNGGTLACGAGCEYNTSGCWVCGDGVVDPNEDCEGAQLGGATCSDFAFIGGTLTCSAACTYNTSGCNNCGDGIMNGSEACDGADLGGASCESLGLSGGDLGCTPSCTFDFLGCDIAGMPFGDDGYYAGFVLQPAVLPCDDISATGTNAGLFDDDNLVVNIGFTMQIYGAGYTQANIQSNGAVGFGNAQYMSYTNACLPTITPPTNNMLYAFWDDLNPGAAGAVRYQALGSPGSQRFVVQWDVPHFGGNTNDLIRVQAVLHEASGQIEVCYPDTTSAGNSGDNGAEATAGIQLNSATALQYSCNTPSLTSGTMLLYVPL